MAKDRESKRCAKPGCKAWAVRGEELCYAHLMKRGLYRRFFTDQEVQAIEEAASSGELALDDVIELLRVLIGRVIEEEEDPRKALPLVERGIRSLVSALRARRALSGEAADGLAAAFAQALDELSTELGIEL
ncbi:MAG TPA: hypothetical protein DCP08_00140 [Chloroflexi bacterium]|nr:hypothetical protein [Chloroflexota bacterium]